MNNSLKKKKGFTLIELLVSISIFIIILTVVSVSHRQGENKNIFRLEAFNIEDSIRDVQNMALTGKEIDDVIPKAYGIYFSETGNNIIIYGDEDGDNIFSEKKDLVYSRSTLSNNIYFKGYASECGGIINSASLNIDFIPPQPTMIINNVPECTSVTIDLKSSVTDGGWNIYFDTITGRVWTEFKE